MSISFADAPGNLFNCLGAIGSLIKNMRSYQATQLTAMTDTTSGVVAQFNNESDIQAIMGGSYISLLNSVGGFGNFCRDMAAPTINRKVFRDNPRISQNLQSLNTVDSILEVIRQMRIAGASVLAQTVAATPGSFTGNGNGKISASVKRPSDGLTLENMFAETLLFTCTADSYTGGAIEGNESITVTGTGSQSNLFAFDWPLGSDAQTTLNAIDGNVDVGSGNLLTNSGFASWTGNTPSNFTINAGSSTITKESSIVYDGSFSLAITGNGATLTNFQQVFDDSTTGTGGTLDPLTQYSFNLWIRRDGTVPANGTLRISLQDGLGVVVQDASGINNTFSIDLTALSTVFTAYSGMFRTPLILPAGLVLVIELVNTPLTNGRTVYIDKMSLGLAQQLYTHGPYLAVHAGSSPFASGDYGTCAITNSRGAAGTLSTFQTLFFLLYSDAQSQELLLPSSATPTISDNLIN